MEFVYIAKDEVLCDEDEAQDYVNVLNGIVVDCFKNAGFSVGYRNTIAVDLTVSAYMLGLDPIDVLDKLVELKVINPEDDDETTCDRVRTVMDYKDRFDWDYMIDPEQYERTGSEPLVAIPITYILK